MAYIEAICISRKKGVVKKPIQEARFVENWGIEGDAHAGPGHRQVSLLAGESIDRMKEIIPQLSQGAFAENLITRGISLQEIAVGDRLQIGESVFLEVTQIGKECHTACAIMALTGDCIMPREGIFARVLRGGIVRPGDSVKVINRAEKSKGVSAQQTVE
jgi:MOSC domain-containing protein YiiM